ncbi:SIS domain-containing protein [Paraconexibacter antarcticus]|uniref:SIS domain-containing protein n=1 Tax=Paraconexibacter antarcticus TaxID=2949664 RepID=A0ABY5DQT8_9ACTN|nr:SIS domain-containing protein [Paraconexibacter antarcticus]UTI64031.1 SIS domain-containing protein [Paraconexibacter antarcticus]
MTTAAQPLSGRLAGTAAARAEPCARFFAAQAPALAELCHAMAERFLRGGRLLACGTTAADRSDVRHVAVEFVHPVIVGKRALPALGLEAAEVALLTGPEDIVMRFDDGTLTVELGERRWTLAPHSGDRFVDQELIEQSYHVLWELVHVFFEHRGLLGGRRQERLHDSGASSFLYPFLAQTEDDLPGVLADVRASVLTKAAETTELRAATLAGSADAIAAATATLRTALDAGGTLLALGNGGSATDAQDVVADLRHPPPPAAPRRALDLAEDPAILTAIANDVGHEAVFARQVIAHARPGDVVLGISTSGGSANVLSALAEARRRRLPTIALVGYDGGRVLAEGLADHVVVSPSEHIPRIQEAQATVLHLLVAAVLAPGAAEQR